MKQLRSLAARAFDVSRQISPVLAVDAIGVVGCGLIVYGAGLVYQPAGFLVAGAMLLAGAWLIARR